MLLTVKDVAQKLNVSQSCIYQLVESGRIPHHRIGLGRGAIRFTEADVIGFLETSREDAIPTAVSDLASKGRNFKHLKL